MASITLDEIKSAVNKKYAPFIIENVDKDGDVKLLPTLRLPETQRKKLFSLQARVDSLQDVGEDGQVDAEEMIKLLSEMVACVAENEKAANRLIAALGDDPAAYEYVFGQYTEATQVGEASPSES